MTKQKNQQKLSNTIHKAILWLLDWNLVYYNIQIGHRLEKEKKSTFRAMKMINALTKNTKTIFFWGRPHPA